MLQVAHSLAYLFFHWPYLVNAVIFAERQNLRFYLWVGHLPSALRESFGRVCLESRWREGFDVANTNHYNKVISSSILLDHPDISGIFYKDTDAFINASKFDSTDKSTPVSLHSEGVVDAAFPCTSLSSHDRQRLSDKEVSSGRRRLGRLRGTRGPRGFRLKSTKFYLRDRPATRALLRDWLDLRCGAKDQLSLWYAVYSIANANGCAKANLTQLGESRYYDAYHTERPSLNHLWKKCRALKLACGDFLLTAVEHEGAVARKDGVVRQYKDDKDDGPRTMRLVPLRGSRANLPRQEYRKLLGLDLVNAQDWLPRNAADTVGGPLS